MTVNGYVGGQGPLLIFLHGFGGDAQLSWKQTMLDFSENFTVAAIDLVWFGKSHSLEKPCLETQVEALHLFLESYFNSDTLTYTLIGHSYGGFVALADFYENPGRVERLVILNSPGITYNTDLLHDLEKKAGVTNYWELFVLKEPWQIDRLNQMAFVNPPAIPGFVLDETYEKYFAHHHTELTILLTSLKENQERFQKQAVQFPPSMVLWGENDAVFPVSEGKKLADFMKAQWVVIPNVGHSAPFENYSMFKRALTEFLASETAKN